MWQLVEHTTPWLASPLLAHPPARSPATRLPARARLPACPAVPWLTKLANGFIQGRLQDPATQASTGPPAARPLLCGRPTATNL